MSKRSILGIAVFLVIVVFYFGFCSYTVGTKYNKQNENYYRIIEAAETTQLDTGYIDKLWNKTVKQSLSTSQKSDIYRESQLLTIPLYAAFSLNNTNYIQQFKDYFNKVYSSEAYKESNTAAKSSLIFLASCFLNLCETNKIDYDLKLKEKTLKELISIYNQSSTSEAISFTNMNESIQFKLSEQTGQYKHQKAINEEELLIVAAAANLYQYDKASSTLKKIVSLIEPLISNETVVYINDYWLYQPGIRADDENYLYSGSTSLNTTKINTDITADIINFSRMPLILQSMKHAVDQGGVKYIDQLLTDLSRHYLRDLIVYPSGTERIFKSKNFMNGDNGFLRKKDNEFYNPFELSANIYGGAWVFLDTDEIKGFYTHVYALLPLEETELSLLINALPTNELNQNMKYLLNNYIELDCYLASCVELIP